MQQISKNAIKNSILACIGNTYYAQGVSNPPVNPGSHIYGTADALATTLQLVQSNINQDLASTSELTAVGTALDQLAASYGIQRKQPASAIGFIQITAIDATNKIFLDTTYQLTDKSGRIYTPTTAGYYSSGSLIQVISVNTGLNQDLPKGSILTWRKVPINSQGTAITYSDVSNGTDLQTDADLQSAIQRAKRAVNSGGSADLYQTCSSISPYADAGFIYPCIQGAGSVHIALSAPANISKSRTRVVPQSQINLITQAINSKTSFSSNTFIQTVQDEFVDMALLVDSSNWVDSYPMPAVQTTVTIISYDSNIVQSITFTSPYNYAAYYQANYTPGTTINLTSDQLINISTIVRPALAVLRGIDPFTIQSSQVVCFSQTGTSSPYTITATLSQKLDLDGSSFVFPSHKDITTILNSLLSDFANIGAGEKAAITTFRTQRYPVNPIWDNRITDVFSTNLEKIQSIKTATINYLYDASTATALLKYTSPPITASVSSITDPPNIFVPNNLAIYPIQGYSQ